MRQRFEGLRRVLVDIEAIGRLQVGEQFGMRGEAGLLGLQCFPGEAARGRRIVGAHLHQVGHRQQQRSLDVAELDTGQELVVDLLDQVFQGHVALPLLGFGELRGIVLGQQLLVAGQPVHAPLQALGRGGVEPLRIRLQVGLEGAAGLFQASLVDVLQLGEAHVVEGVLLGGVEQGARLQVQGGFLQPGLRHVLQRLEALFGFVEATAVEVGRSLQVRGEGLACGRLDALREHTAQFLLFPAAGTEQVQAAVGQGLGLRLAQPGVTHLAKKRQRAVLVVAAAAAALALEEFGAGDLFR